MQLPFLGKLLTTKFSFLRKQKQDSQSSQVLQYLFQHTESWSWVRIRVSKWGFPIVESHTSSEYQKNSLSYLMETYLNGTLE